MIARGLVVNGAHVFIVARKAKQCDAASSALNAQGPGPCPNPNPGRALVRATCSSLHPLRAHLASLPTGSLVSAGQPQHALQASVGANGKQVYSDTRRTIDSHKAKG